MSTWITWAKEAVQVGDLVALSVLKHSDAVGRIVGETDHGRIQCVLIRGGNGKPGDTIIVEPGQLLVKVYA